MKNLIYALLTTTILATTAKCEKEQTAPVSTSESTVITIPDTTAMIAEDKDSCGLWFGILSKLAKKSSCVFSPFSLQSILGMTCMIAREDYQLRICDSFFMPGKTPYDFHDWIGSVTMSPSANISNLALGASHIIVPERLDSIIVADYSTRYERLSPDQDDDFDSLVMGWLSRMTGGKLSNICHLKNQDDPESQSALALANTIAIDAKWRKEFYPSDFPLHFYKKDGERIILDAFCNMSVIKYCEDYGCQACSIPLYEEGTLYLDIILPDKSYSLDSYPPMYLEKAFKALHSMTKCRTVSLTIPQFSIEQSLDMLETLDGKESGMISGCQFSLADEYSENASFRISKLAQTSRICVGLEGVSAVVASIEYVDVVTEDLLEWTPPKKMYINRPFYYMISDHSTGAVLFAGSFNGD